MRSRKHIKGGRWIWLIGVAAIGMGVALIVLTQVRMGNAPSPVVRSPSASETSSLPSVSDWDTRRATTARPVKSGERSAEKAVARSSPQELPTSGPPSPMRDDSGNADARQAAAAQSGPSDVEAEASRAEPFRITVDGRVIELPPGATYRVVSDVTLSLRDSRPLTLEQQAIYARARELVETRPPYRSVEDAERLHNALLQILKNTGIKTHFGYSVETIAVPGDDGGETIATGEPILVDPRYWN